MWQCYSSKILNTLIRITRGQWVNTLRPRQNGRHFADGIFKCISLNENVWISIKISFNFVPKGPINNIPALVQIMAWRRSGDKPLSEPMMVSLPTHICVTRPQWVNTANMATNIGKHFKILWNVEIWIDFPQSVATNSINDSSQYQFYVMSWCRPGNKPSLELKMILFWHYMATLRLHGIQISMLNGQGKWS